MNTIEKISGKTTATYHAPESKPSHCGHCGGHQNNVSQPQDQVTLSCGKKKGNPILRPFRRLAKGMGKNLENWANKANGLGDAAMSGFLVGAGTGSLGLIGGAVAFGSGASSLICLSAILPFGAAIGAAVLVKCYYDGKNCEGK